MIKNVRIPQKVAEAIEKVWRKVGYKDIVIKHMYLNNWTQLNHDFEGSIIKILEDYAQDNPITYMRALVEGYNIEYEPLVVDIFLKDGSAFINCNKLWTSDPFQCGDMNDISFIQNALNPFEEEVGFENNCMSAYFKNSDIAKYIIKTKEGKQILYHDRILT